MCVGVEIAGNGGELFSPSPMSLLEAFPAPPSHIPAGPNPPPSRPPSFPLPPVPGPSRIALPDVRRSSSSSSTSAGVARRSASIVGRPHPPESLTRLAISPTPLLDDDYDVTFPPPPPIPRHRHHDSISQIDMRDLPAADDDEPHTTIPPFNAFRRLQQDSAPDPIDSRNIPIHRAPPFPSGYQAESPTLASSLLSPTLSPREIHLEIRATRSKSSLHKKALRARSGSRSSPRSPVLPADHPPVSPILPPLPTPKNSLPSAASKAERSTSPDIDFIISATPRPLRRQPSSFSDLGVGNPRTVSRKSSLVSAVSARSRKSSAVSATSPGGASDSVALDDLSHLVVREAATWEIEINGRESDGEEDSDSSLDLHTPLPHLMVKHGLLSPHSKLLPRPEDGESRPESILSMATTSGILKDERNTPMRKERHRDGKMLRGGLGLTTGLGWSDSEDEDAPSAFTKRLSSLTLSRQSSSTSIRSSSSYFARRIPTSRHPLSKSYSGRGGGVSFDEGEELAAIDEWGQTRPRTKSTARSGMPPPTSWHGRSGAGSRLSRSSTASSASIKIRATKSSPSPDTESPVLLPIRSRNSSDDTIQTPSSASSSLSIKLPLTPQDDVLSGVPALTMTRKRSKIVYDKDKHLPPLPIQPILKKQPSRIGMVGGGKPGAVPFPMTPVRSRAGSITLTNAMSTPSTPKPTAMVKPTNVRPLHLTQRIASVGDRPAVPVPGLYHATSATPLRSREGVKPTIPSLTTPKSVPRLSALSMSRLSSVSTSSAGGSSGFGSMSSSPVSPTDSSLKPKPRIGTGMTYRKSSYSLASSGTGAGGQEAQQRMGDGRKTPLVSSGIPHPSALNGLGIRTRSKTPVIPKAPTTAIGQAF